MSEISVRMDVDVIFPVTSRRGCDANVRIILVSPSNETAYMLREIGVSDVFM